MPKTPKKSSINKMIPMPRRMPPPIPAWNAAMVDPDKIKQTGLPSRNTHTSVPIQARISKVNKR